MRADDGGGIDATRSALADSRFDAARAEGAAPTIEQALELARTANVDASPPDGEDLQELTSREREVLRLLTRELTDAQIAQQLVVSRRTVHAHLRSIYRKLDVSSRAAAARWAAEHSLRS
jgi:DNA-binding NarL/FixJ family response regulator